MSALIATTLLSPALAQGRRIEEYDPGAHTAALSHTAAKKTAKHPPKTAPASTTSTEGEAAARSSAVAESSGSAPPSGEEPFSGNGGGSPFCGDPSALSASSQRNCETSDFLATPDPSGNYAFDVNINTSPSNWSNDLSATIENFLQFGWIALVALVHGLLVIFEWCYSLNLLSEVMTQVAHGLHQTQLTFTQPWMVLALAIASVFALYHGLIRRRVAETLGQVLMMLAMMIGGLWVIANPQGTVGAVAQWANAASLGTLGAATNGSPENGKRTLANGMQSVFGTVISAPWCYMEFGNERWCHEPGQMDKELQKAALTIAKSEEEKSKGGSSSQDKAHQVSATLLRRAHTNGELFLALPANELERNSVKTKGALLNVLCEESESADKCTGNTASQAEFRTEKGTGSRVIGLILIWIGALGMLLLFGFLAFRLLEAAIASIFYLLLAPVAVLAPALGDGGRAAFRGWGMRLLAAVISKLIYSFLLGVVLLMMGLLLRLTALGWWAQWLLVSALWWVALHHRHKIMGFANSAHHGHETRSMRWYYRMGMAQDVGRFAGWARHKLSPPPPATNRTRQLPPAQRSQPHGSAGGAGPNARGGGSPVRPNEGPSSQAPQAKTRPEPELEKSPEEDLRPTAHAEPAGEREPAASSVEPDPGTEAMAERRAEKNEEKEPAPERLTFMPASREGHEEATIERADERLSSEQADAKASLKESEGSAKSERAARVKAAMKDPPASTGEAEPHGPSRRPAKESIAPEPTATAASKAKAASVNTPPLSTAKPKPSDAKGPTPRTRQVESEPAPSSGRSAPANSSRGSAPGERPESRRPSKKAANESPLMLWSREKLERERSQRPSSTETTARKRARQMKSDEHDDLPAKGKMPRPGRGG